MDDPSLLTVRRSLLNKLDEIANTPRQTPTNTPHDTPKHTPNDTPRETPDLSMSSSSPNTSGLVTPDSPPPYRGDIDSRTFVRPRKKKITSPAVTDGSYGDDKKHFDSNKYDAMYDKQRNEKGSIPHDSLIEGVYDNSISRGMVDHNSYRGNAHNSHNTAIRNQLQQKGNSHVSVLALSSGSLGSEEDDHLSSASEGSYCKLADVEDVNTIARLQEESLKLPDSRARAHEENIKLANARSKISRLPAPRTTGRVSAGSSQEDLLGPASRLSNASPRRDNLSPPISPYTSNSSLNATSGGSNGIRLAAANGYRTDHCSYRGSAADYGGSRGPPDLYGSPVGSRGGSPARDVSSIGARRSRLPPPQV